ncbi:hypothetical protein ACHAWO_001449 [Cyclotella atomus]|uniref:Uncharacterized protein n=1 Tax=Cyclotella atomus TaxID=382360 RepID=A0ABD3PDZ2_9STRA
MKSELEPIEDSPAIADTVECTASEVLDLPSCLPDKIENGMSNTAVKSNPPKDEYDTSQPDEHAQQSLRTEIQHRGIKQGNGSSPPNASSNFVSATATILGNTSDRNDFIPHVVPDNKRKSTDSDTATDNEIEHGGGIINGFKKWFSSQAADCDDDEPVEHDYHREVVDNIQSAIQTSKSTATEKELKLSQVKSLDDNNYNESLLDKDTAGDLEMGRQRSSTYDETEVRRGLDKACGANEGGDGKSKFRYSNSSWTSKTRSETDDELRVMGECSFFYDDMDNEENNSPLHRIPGHEHNGEEKENGYFNEGYQHKFRRARAANPRQVTQAITSSARRQWTERRYRRRLKQSSFEPPQIWATKQHQIESVQIQRKPELPTCELTTEHRQAFLAAHAALNDKLVNEYSRNKHAINLAEYGHDLDIDLDLNLAVDDSQKEEIRADLTKSSLAIRGSGQIRLPVDNVRLVMDSHLQPGILSVESRAGDGGYMGYENYGNGNRYGNINANEVVPLTGCDENKNVESKKRKKASHRRISSEAEQPWRRNELSYVLTVDDGLYRRLFEEINDSYRLPMGMYYCCHLVESEGSHDHVGIGVAVSILMVVFLFLVVGMLRWPMD